MKYIVALLLLVASVVNADTTSNLITGQWTGTVPYSGTGGGVSGGGSQAGYNSTTNTLHFTYNQATASQIIGINTALQGSGVQLSGYNYSWQYLNQNPYNGTLTANVRLGGANNSVLESYSYTMGPTTDWTTMSGTQNFTQQYDLATAQRIGIAFTGKDARWWAGYWGPQVRDVNLSLNYSAATVDPCVADPLSSTTCAGYQAAYTAQQCTANPLYATSCPGYATAYQTQQCSANPLYATTCPGYATAYHDQQCSANPLYMTDCSGYQQAYFNQQCQLNGLYDRTCPNYSTAYATKNLLTTTTVPSTVTTTTVESVSTTTSTTASVAISDPVVSNVVTTPSTTSATGITSVISVINQPAPVATTVAQPPAPVVSTQTQQAQQTEAKKTDTAVASVTKNSPNAKAAATEKAKELAATAAKATTMEAQVATQGVVVGLMGYVPGFTAYQNSIVPDTMAATVARQYHKPVVDNRNVQRSLTGRSDARWQEMVDSQYNLGK